MTQYTLLDKIGHGGMGQVFRATDHGLEIEVAIKFMDPGLAHDDICVKRFLDEARKLARIDHPNIVRVMAAGKWDDGRPYFVMELLRGTSLAEVIKRGPLPEAEAIRIATDALSALNEAHVNGIIHRDIKSSNIMICQGGRVKLIDFGIARDDAASSVSVTGKVLGTPAYMSPEQANGHRATPQSDLYSIGIVIYEMLVGVRPFRAETPIALLKMHTDAPPPELPSNVSPPLRQVVNQALAKDPAHRYSSAHAMAEALRQPATAKPQFASQPVATPNPVAPSAASNQPGPGYWQPPNLGGQATQSFPDDPSWSGKTHSGKRKGLLAALGAVVVVGVIGTAWASGAFSRPAETSGQVPTPPIGEDKTSKKANEKQLPTTTTSEMRETKSIPFTTEYERTASLPKGQSRTTRQGRAGQLEITWQVTKDANGKKVGAAKEIGRKTLVAMRPRIVQIGTAESGGSRPTTGGGDDNPRTCPNDGSALVGSNCPTCNWPN